MTAMFLKRHSIVLNPVVRGSICHYSRSRYQGTIGIQYRQLASLVDQAQESSTTAANKTFSYRKQLPGLDQARLHVKFGSSSQDPGLFSSVQIRSHGDKLTYTAPGLESEANIPSLWLRDHCQCHHCKHPVTKQRLLEFEDLEGKENVSSIETKPDCFTIKWADGHESTYPRKWLEATLDKRDHRGTARQGLVDWKEWQRDSDGNIISPEVDYADVMASDRGVGEWLLKVRQYGYCYVDNCPPTPEATDELLQRIAYVRNTHYGGFWDFTSDLSKGDTAYTQLGIGPHTDNTYFTDPAGLQLFHLLSHTDGQGGESGLVDGFAAANALLRENPEAYNILATVPIHCHASGNEGMSIWPTIGYPVLVHDPTHGHLVQVRWNNTDRAEIDLPVEDTSSWYNAAGEWVKVLKRFELSEQLKPGRPLIFDNWRVLHARTAFTGKRRMCGGYINHDDYVSRFKSTNWGNGELLRQASLG